MTLSNTQNVKKKNRYGIIFFYWDNLYKYTLEINACISIKLKLMKMIKNKISRIKNI